MKAIVQRVLKSSVTVDGKLISSIGRGYLVLVGIHQDDTLADMDYLVKKILNIRLFEDDSGKRWMKNVMEMNYEILCVSQFTLYYSLKGNKPDFRHSMKSEKSKEFYEQFLSKMKLAYSPESIRDGEFGALMQVDISNDGPVTIELESAKIPRKNESENTIA